MQDSGQPEDAGTAEPEGARTEETRQSISRRQGSERPGEPGRSNLRPSRRMKQVGKPTATSGGAAGRAEFEGNRELKHRRHRKREIRGNSKIRCRQSRKMQEPGQPGNYIGRRNWKREAAGQPNADATEALKDTRIGATRGSVAGRAGRCKSWATRDAS